jgi:hypothetical protein
MWIALTVPFMVVGCVVAITPVLFGSVLHHRSTRAAGSDQHDGQLPVSERNGQASRPSFELVCPPCGTVLRAVTPDDLLDAVTDHAWRNHGVPNPERVLATAGAAPDKLV